MSNEEARENVRTIQKGYLKLIEQKVDEGTFLTDDFEGTWKVNTPLTEIYKRNAESLEVVITALEENQKLRATQRWIPVSERLPEDDKEVLVSYRYKNDKEFNTVTIDSFGDIRKSIVWSYYEVVAWMPLPEPYKGDEDE